MTAAMTIPRRPVPSNSIKHVRKPSLASSSIYSDQAETDTPNNNFSQYSLETVPLDDDIHPQIPPKDKSPPVPSKDIDNDDFVPPIPPKDAARSDAGTSAFRLADNNFQKPEIWRRRSTRSNSDLSFEDLKLSKSNGSTAASPPRVQPPERSLPPIPTRPQKEKSILRKAPPIPSNLPKPSSSSSSSPPLPHPQPDYMGAKASKLRKKESYGSSSTSPSHLPGRLPTPDYQKTDKQVQHTPNVLSPVSPASPESPDLPPSQQSSLGKVTSIFKTSSSPNLPQVQIQPSLDSDLTFGHSRSSSDTLTVVAPTETTIFSAPRPHKANAASRILTPQPSPPVAVTVRSPPPQTPKSPFSARIIAFQNAGTIHPGPPLDVNHYDCYQNHRFMRPSRNEKCPLACMVCDKRDTEKRWSCTWCCLRICTRCMDTLAANGKDLKKCIEKVGKSVGHGDRGGTRSERSERVGS